MKRRIVCLIGAVISLIFIASQGAFGADDQLKLKPLPLGDVQRWFEQSGRVDATIGQPTGLEILAAKSILTNKGLYKGFVEEDFVEALRTYQKQSGLVVTGKLEAETYVSLNILPCIWWGRELKCSHPGCKAEMVVSDVGVGHMITCPSIQPFIVPTSYNLCNFGHVLVGCK